MTYLNDPYILCFLPALIVYGWLWYLAIKDNKKYDYWGSAWIVIHICVIGAMLFSIPICIGLIHFLK